jgi:hypothetical protein
MIDGITSSSSQRRTVRSSRRKPYAPASEPGQIATVFVAFATIGFLPIHRRAGKEMSVPPPAMELIAPASVAATKMMMTLRLLRSLRFSVYPERSEGSSVRAKAELRISN